MVTSRTGTRIEEETETEDKLTSLSPVTGKLKRRLSDAVRGWGNYSKGNSKERRIKRTVISNRERVPEGPDTPMPVLGGNMIWGGGVGIGTGTGGGGGWAGLSEVYVKGKEKLMGRGKDVRREREREEMKKKIVVIGVSEQDPGMF
ncbi:hypothetical protein G7Y89_g15774 [Cudoniella acicularis]|uniref:Uncharacterized protein n=1 Tax=Cudoniella acicularis TaxID=354080 RepID=A0A8H4VHJ5_9HELO|nr:hypothetical protein G7Y89_g15774 [Cudoniella acicularis]